MTLQQVSAHVHVETAHLGSNNSIIAGADGVALVDTPHKPTDAIAWRTVVDGFGRTRFVVNTDHHPDHTIGNFWMAGEVVSHRGTRDRLLNEAPDHDYLARLFDRIDPEAVPLLAGYRVRVPEVVFSDRLDLHLGDVHLELSFQPGHTANSLIAFLPEDGVVFTGDIVCEAGLPSFQDSRLWDWFDAIEKVASYDFSVLVPGHGEVADRAVLDRYREWGREVVGQVAAAIGRGEDSDQAAAEIRFADNIHVDTEDYVGYPDDLIEMFQRRSVARIYDDLVERPDLATR
ncbi:MBL fold metallo-hydrolase [Pseudonocardia sulfidoxydans NBRC 16205]|uniref:MBL fold metallo-hydrolase n=1 Tax=Pseudonocardia sulfidoxydans NBRC 16205 TaxID=1223511 RepID=A0A511DKS2_9PSEU|nr:MBL fold metallo-hydrolase [Pseudonocardia sulfidoxydans]GEL25396.1 MBL fold metallo-hydrolase [Pseudonocardia sulfidoxydans NBRC 16205]